jgi:regulatory protein
MSPGNTYLFEKAQRYCAYTERSIFDVRKKLQEWKASEKTIEEIIRSLEKEDFINEERYAVSFAYGKLRNNKWGRVKIFHALSQKNIPEIYIQMGLNELDEEEYLNTLKSVIASKKVTGKDEFTRQNKLVSYAIQKGFQPDLAWKVVKGEI